MAIAYRGGTTTSSISTTVPVLSTLPGDLILIVVSSTNTTAWSQTGANKYLPAYTVSGAGATWVGLTANGNGAPNANNGFSAWLGYNVTTTGTTSVTLSGVPTTTGGFCTATFSGCSTTNPIAINGTPQGQGTASLNITSQALGFGYYWQPGQLLLGMTGASSFSTTPPSGGGWGTTPYNLTNNDTVATYVTGSRQSAITYQIATYPQSRNGGGAGYWQSPAATTGIYISVALGLVINPATTTNSTNFLELL